MKTLERVSLALAAMVAAAFFVSSYSVGEEKTAPAAKNDSKDASLRLDEHIAACLVMDNENEVAAAQIAEKKGDNEEVRNFAQNMVRDHNKLIGELEKFAGRHSRRTARHEAARERSAARAAEEASHGHGDLFVRIHEEIKNQCRASMQRELDSKEGKAFDECYMGTQIVMHIQMVDVLTVLEKHATPDLQKVLAKGRETDEEHLKNAKQVMKDINDVQTTASSKSASEN